jgi:hypothetical protein
MSKLGFIFITLNAPCLPPHSLSGPMYSVSLNAESTMSARERPENVLIDYVHEVRLCLRTAATNGPIVHLPGDV